MKPICILKCDTINQKLNPYFPDYNQMFHNLFQGYSPKKLSFNSYNCFEAEFPKITQDYSLYIITGSEYSCYEKKNWIKQLKNLTQKLYKEKKKLLGICFGHQIIAEALGGKVEKATSGWGLGIHTYETYEKKDFLDPYQKKFSLLVSHQDQVVELPSNAELLGGSSFCPNAFFKIGENFLSLQPHPEFTVDYSKKILEIKKKKFKIQPQTYAEALNSYDLSSPSLSLVMNWIFNFFKIEFKKDSRLKIKRKSNLGIV